MIRPFPAYTALVLVALLTTVAAILWGAATGRLDAVSACLALLGAGATALVLLVGGLFVALAIMPWEDS